MGTSGGLGRWVGGCFCLSGRWKRADVLAALFNGLRGISGLTWLYFFLDTRVFR